MTKPAKLKFSMYDSEDREVAVTVNYYPGCDAYYDRGWGGWLPGDQPDMDIVSVTAVDPGASTEEIEEDEEEIYSAAAEVYRAELCEGDYRE